MYEYLIYNNQHLVMFICIDIHRLFLDLSPAPNTTFELSNYSKLLQYLYSCSTVQ